MKLRDYKQALRDHFGVATSNQLRKDKAWLEFAEENGLPVLHGFDAWKQAYEAVSSVSQSPKSERETNAEETASEDEGSGPTENGSREEEITLTVISCQGWDIESYQPLSEETASFTELQDSSGNTVGALLQYSPEQSQQLIGHFRGLSLHSPNAWHQGRLNSAVVDQLGAASAVVASGLQTGQLLRVVGPPELVSGISKGIYKLVQSDGAFLGTVKNAIGSKFAGQLQFAQASAVPILAPVVAYQVLHAIVGTQQLNQINQRLAHMEKTLEELHVRQEAEILGEIYYAINVLDDIEAERVNTGVFTADASNRLALVEKNILAILERNRLLVERFRDKAKHTRSQRGRQGARSAAELIKSDGAQAIHDMQCLIGLIAADLKLEQMLLLQAMQNNPADVGRRQERIRDKMQKHEQALENLPSVKELERHADACLKAMRWWEKLTDFGQTKKEVRESQAYGLEDAKPALAALKPGLNSYVFWQDKEGIQVFSMSGDDLRLRPTQLAAEQDLDVLQVMVKEHVVAGSTYKLQIPEIAEPVRVAVDEEVEPGLWLGKQLDQELKQSVLIRAQDYFKPCPSFGLG
ncbi:hypothetical protein [Nodosilinea sp. E11]|uniref:hypothetical protein n=1 Tax=Nodosilinea sp. E11 TaxID=3037479 RepID=UPI0029342ABD|nr:hypothetical protein [Nodosilinea sp. E11]WOD37218.1 hypothetical protein RRF56_01800 [Nodosilinea sp. E11]